MYSQAISLAKDRIDRDVDEILDIIINCKGKVVITGMGKTGLIGRKLSATLASTGTTSIFLHASEGVHGDLGILEKKDVVIAISNSGNTDELISILPYIKFMKLPVIALTGNLDSRLARSADKVIDCSVPQEYEPFGLVPTASTTVALAVGDALAVALLKERNFKIEDLARFHPGGTIGKRLLLTVKDLMHAGEKNPIISENTKMNKVIVEMTSKGLGCASVVNQNKTLIGIITDGDLRRAMLNFDNVLDRKAVECMTESPLATNPDKLAVDALNLMEDHKITMLPVTNEENVVVGLLHMHDLINAGVVG